ncbi:MULTISPECIES: oligopeptide ABC transporter permease [Fictibacillus]|jgi:oligopeptide transport system permease protein|uniref:oligopeptide ABC transporter permease n=1 Tax=Fictibacillus TaxID=1329200 RepID=UPI0018CD702F|nr:MULTISPECIES: oligopeptide ABC transporter permease [unclassified Fictibacillus]MBH0155633.1 ABC transporter permease [Fictibacillus sp. 5RED26]MBH0161221.1 ABC transporter permease [Fictibacillus sp. 26RED30]
MLRYITQRILYMLLTLLIIATITFFLMKLLPGSPFNNQDKLTETQRYALNEKYGLNDPVPVQYINYITKLAQGDLGYTFQFDGRTVNSLIVNGMGPSATVGFEALLFGTIVGLLLGILAALRHNTFLDYGAMVIAVFGIAIPSFVFAGLLQYYVGVKLGWLPVAFWNGPEYHIMPAFSLSVGVIATVARFMRTEMLEILGTDYILMARSKGVSKSAVIFKHSVRNSLIPIVTILGPMAIGLITGSLVIENIFAIPGIGEQFVKAITVNDYPVIMGTTIFYSFLIVSIILIVDILYGIIDPRIRVAGGKS